VEGQDRLREIWNQLMTKYVDTFYRIASRAWMRDNAGNIYSGEQLMLALLLHAKGKRSKEQEEFVGRLLDDPNQRNR
jgi:hypothetical protein